MRALQTVEPSRNGLCPISGMLRTVLSLRRLRTPSVAGGMPDPVLRRPTAREPSVFHGKPLPLACARRRGALRAGIIG